MFAEERKELIIKILQEKKRVTNKELNETLGVSGTTIRTYLSELEEQGQLVRTHGGAILIEDTIMAEDTIVSRKDKNKTEKTQIAKLARNMISQGDTVLLDSGTTCLELARELRNIEDITVITNDLRIALEIQKNPSIQAIFLGGTIRNNYECTIGSAVINALQNYSVDKVFLSANALSMSKGATTPHIENALVKEAIMKSGNNKILLCDSSKIGKRTLCSFAKLTDFNFIISDRMISDKDRKEIEDKGVKVLI
ncbi:MAG: DeoR/GlpR family DNA-binding transcription regulator [Lachnospiraceae bacterium]|nr:DeoR/GlpR family DNA-binding transcription regulator [Lachnospiraceae bacterium]